MHGQAWFKILNWRHTTGIHSTVLETILKLNELLFIFIHL